MAFDDILHKKTIGIIGGTGKEGKGLAYRWAKAGYNILIGSRAEERAKATASELLSMLDGRGSIEGTSNINAVQNSGIVVLAVPYSAHAKTLNSIKQYIHDQLIVDVCVPLLPPKINTVQIPRAGSVGLEALLILGPEARITTAFQNISHEILLQPGDIYCDVLVTGSNKGARAETIALVQAAGMRGWDAGPLENSIVSEGLTSVLIHINQNYRSRHAGIRITGIE